MKKIILIISLILSGPLLKAQNSIDSCHSESSDSTIWENLNDTISENFFENFGHTNSHVTLKDSNLFNKKENKMEPKEKIFTTKKIIIITSLVALQIAFGFDPKFTAINLIWLLF